MTLSRKDFFRQGLFSLGGSLLQATGLASSPMDEQPVEPTPAPAADAPRRATVVAGRCLARSCGCFACVDRCELQAISVVLGEGIRIDEQLCTGCGTCEYVCPVTPKAISFVSTHAEHYPMEGERAW